MFFKKKKSKPDKPSLSTPHCGSEAGMLLFSKAQSSAQMRSSESLWKKGNLPGQQKS